MTERTITKEELLARIESAWTELDRIQARAGDVAIGTLGEGGWSLKDHLAHIAAWELSLVALLTSADRAAATGVPADVDDTDAANAIIHERLRGLTAAEVGALLRGSRAQLRDSLARLTDSDLTLPYSHFQPGAAGEFSDQPVIGWIKGNTYGHVREHLGAMRVLAGEPATS